MVGTCVGSWIKVASVSPDRYWVVLLGQGVVGIFEVFLLGVPPKLAAVWFGPHEVSTACSIGVLGSQLGIAIGFVFPPMLMHNATSTDVIEQGFYVMSITIALVTTAILILIIIFFRDRPPSPPSTTQLQVQVCTEETRDFWKSVKTLFANKSYTLLMVSYGINTGIFYAISALLNQIILIYYPDGAEDAGRIGLIIIGSGMIGSVVCGVILDAFGRFKLTIMSVYVLCLISMITFTFTLDSGLVAVYLVSAFFGFFMTSLLPIGYEVAVELTFPIGEGTSGGIITAVAQAFGICFTYLYSYLLNAKNDKAANLAMTGAIAVGAVLLIFIRFDLKRQKAQVSTKRSRTL
ncbi:hypothetical protein ILUMI_17453 [Ignelater luminosus]|uniref:Major facilitator superfamily (MFS) profile domain-containing protein n=1 Tax=Ignelater luminosus TaxID=2038154 RepID=A0A8K0G1V4_IGNLU|nr:hypothetical protein ILUMI_17453 [Ignelater luminosus]